ncbi:MAG: hypothetical protein R3B84_02590 [Zavarzinella sp.]
MIDREKQKKVSILKQKIAQALHLKQWKAAYDLAQEIVLIDADPVNHTHLREVVLKIIRNLLHLNNSAQLIWIFRQVDLLPYNLDEWGVEIISLRIQAGQLEAAQKMLANHPEFHQELLVFLADDAIRKGDPSQLPEEWRPHYSLVMGALKAYESRNDQEAISQLDGIGLKSPYLSWKLLIRGMVAWANSDDERAEENWKRLKPGFAPALLAETHRQMSGGKQSTSVRNNSSPDVKELLRVENQLLEEMSYESGLEIAGRLTKKLESAYPGITDACATIFYWNLAKCPIRYSSEMCDMYLRTFSLPKFDPGFCRLRSLQVKYPILRCHYLAAYAELLPNTPLFQNNPALPKALARIWQEIAVHFPNHTPDVPNELKSLLPKKWLKSKWNLQLSENYDASLTSKLACISRAIDCSPESSNVWQGYFNFRFADPVLNAKAESDQLKARCLEAIKRFPHNRELMSFCCATANQLGMPELPGILDLLIPLTPEPQFLKIVRHHLSWTELLLQKKSKKPLEVEDFIERYQSSNIPTIKLAALGMKFANLTKSKEISAANEILNEIRLQYADYPVTVAFTVYACSAVLGVTKKTLDPLKKSYQDLLDDSKLLWNEWVLLLPILSHFFQQPTSPFTGFGPLHKTLFTIFVDQQKAQRPPDKATRLMVDLIEGGEYYAVFYLEKYIKEKFARNKQHLQFTVATYLIKMMAKLFAIELPRVCYSITRQWEDGYLSEHPLEQKLWKGVYQNFLLIHPGAIADYLQDQISDKHDFIKMLEELL